MIAARPQDQTMLTSASQEGPSVFAVTVTYGGRQSLLQQMLADLPSQGITKVVVVNNGAHWAVADALAAQYGTFVDVVDMGRNTGSAGGYAAGIQRAYDLGAEFIWLLDDDNLPADGCLAQLMKAYADELGTTPRCQLAVLAFRPDHQADVAAGVPAQYINARRDSFCGFHVLDIPYKLWRRTSWGRPHGTIPAATRVRLDVAPYSGLLVHRELVHSIGVPEARFVLYGDDTEYSWRITACGGHIVLVTTARIKDLEQSWNIKARFPNSFAGWLYGDSDLRAYYGMRNQTYLDYYVRCQTKLVVGLNYRVYKWGLWLFSWMSNRRARYTLLDRAMANGCTARLGVAPEFPLP